MASGMTRGRLAAPGAAPDEGERAEVLAVLGGVTVEQILSGRLRSPVCFDQDHDEWVVVLAGGAVVEVEGERLELCAGDHVLLPAHVTHRLMETEAGTSWLALHGPPPDHAGATAPLAAGTPAGPDAASQQATTSTAGTT